MASELASYCSIRGLGPGEARVERMDRREWKDADEEDAISPPGLGEWLLPRCPAAVRRRTGEELSEDTRVVEPQ